MIDDLRSFPAGHEFEADLCIVGAGAAGIAVAHEFLRSDLRVMVVESGGLGGPEPDTDRLKEGEAEGLAPDSLVAGRGRGFGGTTTLWAGQCIPLDAIDFEERHWVPHSGWPISRDDLAPYYERASALLGVPDESFDETLWRRWRTSPPPLDAHRVRHTYTVWTPKPDLGRAYRAEFRRSRSVRVLLHANVTRIEARAGGSSFDHVVVRSLDGSHARVRARACVLCCGGIENARLLLASGDPAGGGLGNARGNVGRYFQDHPNARCARLATDDPRAIQDIYSLFYRRGRRYLPKWRLAPDVQRAEEVLNCGANLEYEFADEGLNAVRRLYRWLRRGGAESVRPGDLRRAATALPAVASTAYRRFALGRSTTSPPSAIVLQTHAEQAPNEASRVTLSRERDALGTPLARVEWRLTDLDRRTAEVMARTVTEELRRVGLASAEIAGWLAAAGSDWRAEVGDSYHHIGTTRMSDDPAEGVVDADCRLHDVEGLYASGSSVFPTGGFANPTLSVVAMALRLADHVAERLAVSPGRGPGAADP